MFELVDPLEVHKNMPFNNLFFHPSLCIVTRLIIYIEAHIIRCPVPSFYEIPRDPGIRQEARIRLNDWPQNYKFLVHVEFISFNTSADPRPCSLSVYL